jgi:hypothetical protein
MHPTASPAGRQLCQSARSTADVCWHLCALTHSIDPPPHAQIVEEDSGPQWVKASHVARLREMGFAEKAARQALAASGDKLAHAVERLQVCARAGGGGFPWRRGSSEVVGPRGCLTQFGR